jgi:hypothetical protein
MLNFQLTWEDPTNLNSAASATWGWLTIRYGGEILWDDAHWTWVELLEHLSEIWPHLWSEGLPVYLDKRDSLCGDILTGVIGAGPLADQEAELFEFRNYHDLSMGIQGCSLPPLLLVRDGDDMNIMTKHGTFSQSLRQIQLILRFLGDSIMNRILNVQDDRSFFAIRDWRFRTQAQETN